MRTGLLTIVAVLGLAGSAQAQTGTPTKATLRVYRQPTTAPITILTVPLTDMVCNQVRPAPEPVPVTNPNVWRVEDPAIVGRDCVYSDVARFTALTDGSYEGTVQYLNALDEAGAETSRVPFLRRRPNPPGVPMDPRVTH